MLATALAQATRAFTNGADNTDHAIDNLVRYYDPSSGYSGATFLAVQSHDDFAVTAADLWAVSTLNMEIPPNAGRALMDPGPLRTIVTGNLHHLPVTLPLSEVTPEHLGHMYNLYSSIRSMLPPLGKRETNQWVLASKLCARKRPMLFPVRDAKVCGYLADNLTLGGNGGQLGHFQRDLQVFAYLITLPEVRSWIDEARRKVLSANPTWVVDWSDLRVLDIVLWMQTART